MKRDPEDILRRFVCPKCKNHSAHSDEISVARGPFSRMLPVPSGRYLAVSCALCGFTELYDLAQTVQAEDAAPASVDFSELKEEPRNA